MAARLRPRTRNHSHDPEKSLPIQKALLKSWSPQTRRWVCLMLLTFVLITLLMVSNNTFEKRPDNFISSSLQDKKTLSYLHAHEDLELRTNITFAELESSYSNWNHVLKAQDERTIAEAEAHAKNVLPFPVWEAKRRRLRCIGWKATSNCTPDGFRVPGLDFPCNTVVPYGSSGYCEVTDKDTGESFRVMHRYCSSMRDGGKFRCSDAWEFALVPQKAREVVRKAQISNLLLPNIAPNPLQQTEPRNGIVMVVYPELLASAYATIRALREVLVCRLPIELWFRKQEMQLYPEAFTELQKLSNQMGRGITLRAIAEFGVAGFATKVYAIYHSVFESVLFLDADNVPVRDPTFLFESPEFKETGAVFWPDFWHPTSTIFNIQPHSLVWELLDLPFISMFEQESGQLLVNRRRQAGPLELVKFYTLHRPNYFDRMKLAHGDKDLFRFAWLKQGAKFHMIQSPPAVAGKVINDSFCGMTMVQHDAEGGVLFLHRNSHKLMGTVRRGPTVYKAAAIRRARKKRLRKELAEKDRLTLDGSKANEDELENSVSPDLNALGPDGYPDMAIWTHLITFKNTSRRSNYRIQTYEASPDFSTGVYCYGERYLNQSKHFVIQKFANLSYAGLETKLRQFAMEGFRVHDGVTGR